jgi:hypothetical protein
VKRATEKAAVPLLNMGTFMTCLLDTATAAASRGLAALDPIGALGHLQLGGVLSTNRAAGGSGEDALPS